MKKIVMYFLSLLVIMAVAIDASAQTPVLGNIFSSLEGDTLITWIFGLAATFFGTGWVWFKRKGILIAKLAKEGVDVIEEINNALADDALSKKEIERISKELKDVQSAWRELVKKKDQK